MMVTLPPPPPPEAELELELLGAELVVLEGAGAAVAARARVEARRALEKYIVNVLVWFGLVCRESGMSLEEKRMSFCSIETEEKEEKVGRMNLESESKEKESN